VGLNGAGSLRTFSPNECQSKSFEKMNTLLSAIFKYFIKKNATTIENSNLLPTAIVKKYKITPYRIIGVFY